MAKTKAQTSTSNTTFDPSKVVVEKNLTVPQLKLEPGVSVYVRITGAMYMGKPSKKLDADGKTRGPATLLPVYCLFAGDDHECNNEECSTVANKMLASTLNESYPKDSYVGKSFRITKSQEKTKGAGGEYYKFSVALIAEQK